MKFSTLSPNHGNRTTAIAPIFFGVFRRGFGADASKRHRNEKSECVSYRFLLRHGDGHDATVSVGMEDDDIEPLASDEHLSETVQRGDTDFVGMFGGEASGMVRKTEGANFGAVAVAKNTKGCSLFEKNVFLPQICRCIFTLISQHRHTFCRCFFEPDLYPAY